MDILELLKKRKFLLSDGAFGTELFKKGLKAGTCPELWNIEQPEKVKEIYASYIKAGSDIILTNTFGASSIKLKKFGIPEKTAELNAAGIKLAKEAAAGTQALVLASLGPVGEMLEPLGDITETELIDVYSKQIEAVVNAGADGIVFETMMSIEEAVCGLKAAKNLPSLRAVVSMTYSTGPKGFATIMGVTVERAAHEAQDNGAALVGANCGMNPEVIAGVAREYKKHTSLPLWIKPNAGSPECVKGETIYRETPEAMAAGMKKVLAEGAAVIGGCCGSTPEHIKAMARLKD